MGIIKGLIDKNKEKEELNTLQYNLEHAWIITEQNFIELASNLKGLDTTIPTRYVDLHLGKLNYYQVLYIKKLLGEEYLEQFKDCIIESNYPTNNKYYHIIYRYSIHGASLLLVSDYAYDCEQEVMDHDEFSRESRIILNDFTSKNLNIKEDKLFDLVVLYYCIYKLHLDANLLREKVLRLNNCYSTGTKNSYLDSIEEINSLNNIFTTLNSKIKNIEIVYNNFFKNQEETSKQIQEIVLNFQNVCDRIRTTEKYVILAEFKYNFFVNYLNTFYLSEEERNSSNKYLRYPEVLKNFVDIHNNSISYLIDAYLNGVYDLNDDICIAYKLSNNKNYSEHKFYILRYYVDNKNLLCGKAVEGNVGNTITKLDFDKDEIDYMISILNGNMPFLGSYVDAGMHNRVDSVFKIVEILNNIMSITNSLKTIYKTIDSEETNNNKSISNTPNKVYEYKAEKIKYSNEVDYLKKAIIQYERLDARYNSEYLRALDNSKRLRYNDAYNPYTNALDRIQYTYEDKYLELCRVDNEIMIKYLDNLIKTKQYSKLRNFEFVKTSLSDEVTSKIFSKIESEVKSLENDKDRQLLVDMSLFKEYLVSNIYITVIYIKKMKYRNEGDTEYFITTTRSEIVDKDFSLLMLSYKKEIENCDDLTKIIDILNMEEDITEGESDTVKEFKLRLKLDASCIEADLLKDLDECIKSFM